MRSQIEDMLKPYRKLVKGGDVLHNSNDNLRPAHYHIDIPEPTLLALLSKATKEARIELARHFKDMMLCPICSNRKPSEPCICSAHQICSPDGIDAFIITLKEDKT